MNLPKDVVTKDRLSFGVWKYVVVQNEKDARGVRFTFHNSGVLHRQMVLPNELALAAGFIAYIDNGDWMLQNAVSESLNIHGDDAKDKAMLEYFMGRPALNA